MSPRTPAALSHRQAAFTLALLLGLQPVATDVYLPALPLLTHELGARMAHAQPTMAGTVARGGFFTLDGGALGAVLAPVAFGVGSWLSVALDHSGRALMGGLAFWSAATCCVAWTRVRKAGR